MSSETTVRRYRPGDEPGINALFNEVFDQQRPLALWRWKFADGPSAKPELSIVAEAGGQVVGFFGSMLLRLQVGDQTILQAYAGDYAVRRSHRGGLRGLMYRLWQEQERVWTEYGIPFVLGFPNEKHFILGKRLLKYEELMGLNIWHRRLTPRVGLRKRLGKMPQQLEKMLVSCSAVWNRSALRDCNDTAPEKITVTIASHFPPEIDKFWERFRKLYPVMLVRDRPYLDWRYARAMEHRYRIWLAWSAGEIVGMGVAGFRESGDDDERIGSILELASLPPHHSRNRLLRSMLLWLVELSADGVICRVAPSDPVQPALERFGFHLRPERLGSRFAYRIIIPDTECQELVLEPRSWHTMLGDSDDA